jgi:hypothetical protein
VIIYGISKLKHLIKKRMFKYYIITWIVMSWHETGCPVDPPVVDKFGRVSEQPVVYTVMCGQTDSTFHKQRFDSRDSAYAFYKDALRESAIDPDFSPPSNGAIRNVKIDSVKMIILH